MCDVLRHDEERPSDSLYLIRHIDIGKIINSTLELASKLASNKIIDTGVLYIITYQSDIPNLQLVLPTYEILRDCGRAASAPCRSFMSMQIKESTLSISRTASRI